MLIQNSADFVSAVEKKMVQSSGFSWRAIARPLFSDDWLPHSIMDSPRPQHEDQTNPEPEETEEVASSWILAFVCVTQTGNAIISG